MIVTEEISLKLELKLIGTYYCGINDNLEYTINHNLVNQRIIVEVFDSHHKDITNLSTITKFPNSVIIQLHGHNAGGTIRVFS